ncbi:MAG: Na(+)/H(+) antiporter subunit A, partial [Chloroflexi bacterium]|nr:Na(+)/H(+) antiporter subunit A [Chloroflexota bacterium]
MPLAFIAAAPFCLALLLTLPQTRAQLSKTAQTLLSSALMAGLFAWLVSSFPLVQAEGAVIQSLEWMPALGISLSFYLDGLSLLFGLIITCI